MSTFSVLGELSISFNFKTYLLLSIQCFKHTIDIEIYLICQIVYVWSPVKVLNIYVYVMCTEIDLYRFSMK